MSDADAGLGAPAGARRRGAWLTIDRSALTHNVAVIRALLGDRVKVAPVVKADAYGHGLVPVAETLAPVSDALCVATLDEALVLRDAGIPGRIMLLYPVPPDAVAEAVGSDVELTVMSARDASAVSRLSATPRGRGLPGARVQLAIDTGMARGGLPAEAAVGVAATLADDPRVGIAGTWSHMCCPDDAATSAAQAARFDRAVSAMTAAGIAPGERHLAASGGIFAATAPVAEMVRPGLAVYGLLDERLPVAPAADAAARSLRPAMTLTARPVAFTDVHPGGSVGYGGTWRATRESRVATLPVGYGDGYARASQPGAGALVRGRRVPVVGVVSMDALGVDVTDIHGVGYDDDFVLLGSDGPLDIGAGDLARARNTIAWEVLSGMAARLDRVYHPPTGAWTDPRATGRLAGRRRGHARRTRGPFAG